MNCLTVTDCRILRLNMKKKFNFVLICKNVRGSVFPCLITLVWGKNHARGSVIKNKYCSILIIIIIILHPPIGVRLSSCSNHIFRPSSDVHKWLPIIYKSQHDKGMKTYQDEELI